MHPRRLNTRTDRRRKFTCVLMTAVEATCALRRAPIIELTSFGLTLAANLYEGFALVKEVQ
jgi:hypothetical protein